MKIKVKNDADSTQAGKFGELLEINFNEQTVVLGFNSKLGGKDVQIKYFFYEVEGK